MNSTMQEQTGITPHGGCLIDRVLKGEARGEALQKVSRLKSVHLSPTSVSDLEMIAVGAFSPLTGFMGRADYESTLENMHLASGLAWSIPVTLAVSAGQASSFRIGEELALVGDDGQALGILELSEKFTYDKEREARLVYRTTDAAHPGVARLYGQGDVLLAGSVWLVSRPAPQLFPEFRHDPAQSRRLFAQRGWRTVVGFQTRNPIHRAHEYIQKCALEIVDGLFIHPLVGETKEGDIPADVRMRSYQSLLRDYYPPDRTLLGVFPAAMRYAGPREAIFHAICRKNYGCTHFIVGRDHAGVGNYYGTYDAQLIFNDLAPGELGITTLFFEHTFYCRKCGAMVSYKTCPHDESFHLILSGTKVREMLMKGEALPPEFTRPEVAQVLHEGMVADTKPVSEKAPAPRKQIKKVMVIGLDCFTPQLAFDKWRQELPNLSQLMNAGIYGELESIVPPITVPAWASMVTSKDPGRLGVYGFHNRADYSYDKMAIANSRWIKEDAVWDILSRAGKKVVLVGVPPSYPPKPVNGCMVGCFLSPSTQSQYTYPQELRHEIQAAVGGYMVDVDDFRTEDKQNLLHRIYEMTDKRFSLVKHLMKAKEWDFLMMVEMGPDRIHHGFWKYFDTEHPKYEPGSPYEGAVRDYYRYLDTQIGELMERVNGDTAVLVVSDHGAKRMDGGICINEWLMKEGYLHLKSPAEGIIPLAKAEVDWSRTVAWGGGGYYGRLFLNIKGREPQGLIAAEDYESVRDEIIGRLHKIPGGNGEPIETKVFKPQEVYSEWRGVPPDLIIHFGDLYWRAVGSIGLNAVHTFENDTGPDDANHAQKGVFIMSRPTNGHGGKLDDLRIMDVAPTVLDLFEMPIPADMAGKVIGK